jgi:hypothetical protein
MSWQRMMPLMRGTFKVCKSRELRALSTELYEDRWDAGVASLSLEAMFSVPKIKLVVKNYGQPNASVLETLAYCVKPAHGLRVPLWSYRDVMGAVAHIDPCRMWMDYLQAQIRRLQSPCPFLPSDFATTYCRLSSLLS